MRFSTDTLIALPLVAALAASGDAHAQRVPLDQAWMTLPGLTDQIIGAGRDLDFEPIEEVSEVRPLVAEPTPFTIEPGRLAIEASLLDFAYDRHNPDRANERVYAFEWPLLFRYGMTHDLEVQFGIETYARETVYDRDARTRDTADGFGDLILGAKYNLWGNDEGPTAFAILPQLRLPTNRHGLGNRGVEGGVFLPYAVELPHDFELEWTPGFSAIRNSNDDGYTFEWYNLLALGSEVVDNLEWYIEFESFVTAESGDPWVGVINAGLIWSIADDTTFEIGTGWGVTRSADDFNLFLILVQRF